MKVNPKERAVEDTTKVYAIVGELVLIASALDYQLAEIMVAAVNLGSSPMILPVIFTLDAARKAEILKRRAELITADDWRKNLIRHVEKVERIFRYRNLACHTPPRLENGKWILKPAAAAKMLKEIDLDTKTLDGFKIEDLREAITLAEETYANGLKIVENFQRTAAEFEKRRQQKPT